MYCSRRHQETPYPGWLHELSAFSSGSGRDGDLTSPSCLEFCQQLSLPRLRWLTLFSSAEWEWKECWLVVSPTKGRGGVPLLLALWPYTHNLTYTHTHTENHHPISSKKKAAIILPDKMIVNINEQVSIKWSREVDFLHVLRNEGIPQIQDFRC